ncbi:MAG: deoxyribose-phosphate aldolase [Bacteroidetes bacterium HGW-Bacteroidetes-1]|jgi:deoxyribose-phosphate aldolase|nr:MAG: deoxyribose-phosphate aldolase [Bacteroidetes bacterium HGW-Bacteroidetes-1]
MNFSSYTKTADDLRHQIQWIDNVILNETEVLDAYRTIFNCIDLTSLEATDNNESIELLCQKALDYKNVGDGTAVAAVCVYMPFVRQSKTHLNGSVLQVATVACSFPSGQIPLELKLAEVRWAVSEGADEIDMVISRGSMIARDFDLVFNEIKAVKEVCGNAHLKVILETGELKSVELIRKASEIALLAGADFLKTSTGKINPAATPDAVVVMLDTIHEFYQKTGKKAGLKPAGGIADPESALLYYKLVKNIVGDEWLNNRLFRIGASRLADKVKALISN